MSTNNFKFENVLIACPDFNFYHDCNACDCEDKKEDGKCSRDGEWEEFDQFAYDEYISDVQAKFEKLGFESCKRSDNDRNYGGSIIASYGVQDDYDYMIKYIEIIIRTGYYDGANIDYTIDGEFDDNTPNRKKLDKKIDQIIKKTIKVLKTCGTELIKLGSFSNGEAVYQVKNK